MVPTVAVIAFCAILGGRLPVKIDYVALTVYLLTASVISQFGDLSMSAVKRNFGVKDYGKVLPGHGGILDRFDSVLLAAPFAYMMFQIYFPITPIA